MFANDILENQWVLKEGKQRGLTESFPVSMESWERAGVAGPCQGKWYQWLGWLQHGMVIFKAHRELKGPW